MLGCCAEIGHSRQSLIWRVTSQGAADRLLVIREVFRSLQDTFDILFFLTLFGHFTTSFLHHYPELWVISGKLGMHAQLKRKGSCLKVLQLSGRRCNRRVGGPRDEGNSEWGYEEVGSPGALLIGDVIPLTIYLSDNELYIDFSGKLCFNSQRRKVYEGNKYYHAHCRCQRSIYQRSG